MTKRYANLFPASAAERLPLTPFQAWFFEQELIEPQHFNQALLLKIPADIDAACLKTALALLPARHDALRQRFAWEGGRGHFWLAGAEGCMLFQQVRLGALSADEFAQRLQDEANRAQAGLDFAAGPLGRAVLFHAAPGQPGRLLLAIHHLAIEAVSWRVLLEDLAGLYLALRRGEPVPAADGHAASFAEWASWQAGAGLAAVACERYYWQQIVAPSAPKLPLDFLEPPEGATQADMQVAVAAFSPAETRVLLDAGRAETEARLFTALGLSLAEWIGATRLFLAREGLGRERLPGSPDIRRSFGWFTALHPLWLDIAGPEPGQVLEAVREQLRQIPRDGLGYGILRYSGADASLAPAAEPEICFYFPGQIDAFTQDGSGEGLPLELAEEPTGLSISPAQQIPFKLDIVALVARESLLVYWLYSGKLHRPATVEALAAGFGAIMRELPPLV